MPLHDAGQSASPTALVPVLEDMPKWKILCDIAAVRPYRIVLLPHVLQLSASWDWLAFTPCCGHAMRWRRCCQDCFEEPDCCGAVMRTQTAHAGRFTFHGIMSSLICAAARSSMVQEVRQERIAMSNSAETSGCQGQLTDLVSLGCFNGCAGCTMLLTMSLLLSVECSIAGKAVILFALSDADGDERYLTLIVAQEASLCCARCLLAAVCMWHIRC